MACNEGLDLSHSLRLTRLHDIEKTIVNPAQAWSPEVFALVVDDEMEEGTAWT
jgi:hypothetical protein